MPTVLDVCGVPVPDFVQGRSLVKLIDGTSDEHRDFVFSEYAENEEAMIRTDRWKLIYSTGCRERKDGYTTGRPLAGKTVRLYDLDADPDEMTNLAANAEHASLVSELTARLAEHMHKTSRRAGQLPASADADLVLERYLPPAEE